MRIIYSLLLTAILMPPLSGFADDTVDSNAIAQEAIVQEIQEQVTAFNKAYEMNELDTYFAFYLDDVSMWFDTEIVTVSEYKKDWYELIAGGGGVEKIDLSDIMVLVGPSGDTAIAAYRARVQTRMPDGAVTLDNAQETDTWFKVDGQWRVAHLHYASQPAE